MQPSSTLFYARHWCRCVVESKAAGNSYVNHADVDAVNYPGTLTMVAISYPGHGGHTVSPPWCRAIDHHWEDDKFATAGAAVDIWDHSRSEPISTYSWGADSVLSVRFNPVSPCGSSSELYRCLALTSGGSHHTACSTTVISPVCSVLAGSPVACS